MNGAADASPAYVGALRTLSTVGAEILICVADEDDGAVAAIRGAVARRADPGRQRHAPSIPR